jgi:G3E family GTPase
VISELPVPVVLLTGLTREVLEPVELSITVGLPEPALVRHELDPLAGTVTRVVSDQSGVVERDVLPLDHTCATCALRHEIMPTLTRLANTGRWSSMVLSLPVATQPEPLVEAMSGTIRASPVVGRAIRIGAVVAAVRAATLDADLFGDDLLRECDPDRHAGDSRAVGEVLADLVEYADVLALSDGTAIVPAAAAAVLDELRRPGSRLVADPAVLAAADLDVFDGVAARDWVRPENRRPVHLPAGIELGDADGVYDASRAAGGVWTVLVDTWRPFHPERLMERIESLGGGSYRGRGCFWLPTHPDSLAVWAGAGGQLSIGTAAGTPRRGPRTRIVVTGTDDRRDEVLRDLSETLMTDAELARGLARWAGREDGFEPWLGERGASA